MMHGRVGTVVRSLSQRAQGAATRLPSSARILRIGLAFDDVELRAIGIRGERVLWAVRAERTRGASLANEVADLLAATPAAHRWPRPRVYLALHHRYCSLKRIEGLPPVQDSRVLGALIREGVTRFFLTASSSPGTQPRVGGVHVTAPGELWAAAYDPTTLELAAFGCRTHQMKISAAVPANAVVGSALLGERVEWAGLSLTFDASRTLRTLELSAPPGSIEHESKPLVSCSALTEVGDDAWRWADAYGAALRGSITRVAFGAHENGEIGPPARVPAWRMALAVTAVVASLASAALVPGIVAVRAARRDEAVVRRLVPQRTLALQAEAELARVSATLAALDHFDEARRPATVILARFARMLPRGSALLSVKLDSTGGNIVVLAPSAAAVVDALERTPGVAAPEITGPVTRETVAHIGLGASSPGPEPREMERVTIRFRDAKGASHSSETRSLSHAKSVGARR